MRGLTGKVAVVTGAGSGLGRASAIRLAEEGCTVVAVDVDEAAALATIDAMHGGLAVRADVADEQQVEEYLARAVEQFGRVDLHHLNAGIFGAFASLPDIAAADFDRVLAVNVRGQFLGLRGAFRRYREQRSRGSIVVTASIASLTGSGDLLAYHTSKHAVAGLIKSAAVFGGPLGIRVNGVAPGIVPTELFAAAATTRGGKNDMEQRASTTPLRRAGRPDEIAAVTAFLLSDEASYLAGQIVSADGGASVVNTVRPTGGAGAWDPAATDAVIYGDDWKELLQRD